MISIIHYELLPLQVSMSRPQPLNLTAKVSVARPWCQGLSLEKGLTTKLLNTNFQAFSMNLLLNGSLLCPL